MEALKRLIAAACALTLACSLVPLPAFGSQLEAASLPAGSPDGAAVTSSPDDETDGALVTEVIDTRGNYGLRDEVVHSAADAGIATLALDGEAITSAEQAAYDYICSQVKAMAGEIYVSSFDITKDQLDSITQLVFNNPELWWLDSHYSISWYEDTLRAHSVTFAYYCTASQVESIGIAMELRIREALSWIDEGATAFQRAQVLHDYLVRTCSYSLTQYADGSYPIQCHRAVGALYGDSPTPVCQGYALAYKLLLARAGIDALYVGSQEMNHGWNLVCLDGSWYHVDVTWDDPLPDRGFSVTALSHEYFLVSDATLHERGRGSWETTTAAPSDYELIGFAYPTYAGPVSTTHSCPTDGHITGEVQRSYTKAATCTSPGSYDLVTRCLWCQETTSRLTTVVPALGHAFGAYAYDGNGRVGANGTKTARCARCGLRNTVTAAGTALKPLAKAVLSSTSLAYNGKARTPSVTVYDGSGKRLTANVHYALSWTAGRKYPGTYKVTVRGIGAYAGSKTITASFKVKAPSPTKPTVRKAKGAKRSLTLTWKRSGGYATGYIVQAATNKGFTKNVRKATVRKAATVKVTMKKLKPKTAYKVRIRSYCKLNGKTYYSGWSKVKSVRTR